MRNFVIFLFSLAFFTHPCFGLDNSQIFDKYEKAVVDIQHTLFFDSSILSETDLIRRIESYQKVTILDDYFPFASGSGFFITPDGYIVTNYHVIKGIDDMVSVRKSFFFMLIEYVSNKLPRDLFDESEFRQLKEHLKKICDSSNIVLRVIIENKYSLEPVITKKDKELDIALLKVKAEKEYTVLPFGDSDSLKVGIPVTAIGYPFGSLLDYLFTDKKSTLTTGLVSTIRNDTWGIQHTAPINPGNSGGPLIDHNGLAVGINVGLIKDSNSIFFAIPTNKVITWLEEEALDKIVAENRAKAAYIQQDHPKTEEGKLEIGSAIFIKLTEQYSVYVNGNLKGKTPILISDLKPGDAFIEIKSETLYHKKRFTVSKTIKEPFTYQPVMRPYMGSLFVESEPAAATIRVDGKDLGKTPSVIAEVAEGKHKLLLVLRGYEHSEKDIIVTRNKTLRLKESLSKTYRLTFAKELPEGTKIRISNSQRVLSFDCPATWFRVPLKTSFLESPPTGTSQGKK